MRCIFSHARDRHGKARTAPELGRHAHFASQQPGNALDDLAWLARHGARFDPATIGEFEKFVSEATPHVAANAVVGVSGIRRVAFIGLKSFFKCAVELCDTLEAGKDWAASYKVKD